jgi:ribonucleoside-diphosphate reductase alpha chain
MAMVWNRTIFKHIKERADAASRTLADERGACPDAADYGIQERFSNKIAIAPTASISIICGGSSPGIEPNAANSYTHKTLSGSFNVRNHYLKRLLAEKDMDTDEIWSSITVHEGSVQHLDFLTAHEKAVYKTAFEIDQRWLIDLGAERAPYICQSQSLNVFLPADVHKKVLHDIHFRAWKKGVKSLYYCRSRSIQRADVVATKVVTNGHGESFASIAPPEHLILNNGTTAPVDYGDRPNGHTNRQANGYASGHGAAEVQMVAVPLAAPLVSGVAAAPNANPNDYEECLACQ